MQLRQVAIGVVTRLNEDDNSDHNGNREQQATGRPKQCRLTIQDVSSTACRYGAHLRASSQEKTELSVETGRHARIMSDLPHCTADGRAVG